VADIHFQPAVAMMVADAFEKIRINPGARAGGRVRGRACAAVGHRALVCLDWQEQVSCINLSASPGGPGGLPKPVLHPPSAPPRPARPAGNFADGRKTFDVINYDDPAQFAEEREYIRCPPAAWTGLRWVHTAWGLLGRLTAWGCWAAGLLGTQLTGAHEDAWLS
jgi:hypothetical protein